jgi:heme-degrading monooxygenase HmoA
MYVIVWSYETAPGAQDAFRAAYAADGDWARLFAKGAGFVGTSLYGDASAPQAFLTLDRWESAAAHAAFMAAFASEYAALDARFAQLCTGQRRLGAFGE